MELGKTSISQFASLSFLQVISKFQGTTVQGKQMVLDITYLVQHQKRCLSSCWKTPPPPIYACHHWSHISVRISPGCGSLDNLCTVDGDTVSDLTFLCHQYHGKLHDSVYDIVCPDSQYSHLLSITSSLLSPCEVPLSY